MGLGKTKQGSRSQDPRERARELRELLETRNETPTAVSSENAYDDAEWGSESADTMQYEETTQYVEPVQYAEPTQYAEPVQYEEPMQYEEPAQYEEPKEDLGQTKAMPLAWNSGSQRSSSRGVISGQDRSSRQSAGNVRSRNTSGNSGNGMTSGSATFGDKGQTGKKNQSDGSDDYEELF